MSNQENKQPHNFCETPEEKCTMNYCDENGCQNRKRHLVEENKLHPDSLKLLEQCFEELKAKMIRNQQKYGWTNEWLTNDWEDECREHMMQHIEKGDPKDVAIYAMFMMYRGWSTVSVNQREKLQTAEEFLRDYDILSIYQDRLVIEVGSSVFDLVEILKDYASLFQARIADLEKDNEFKSQVISDKNLDIQALKEALDRVKKKLKEK